MQRSKSVRAWVALLLVFTLIGPVVGGLIFWIGGGVLVSAVKNPADLGNLAIGALGISLGLAPVGMIQALITGLISGLVSRGTSRHRLWIAITVGAGGLVSALSLPTALLVHSIARDGGFTQALVFGMGIMFASGVGAALICAVLCMGFRPRRVLVAQSS